MKILKVNDINFSSQQVKGNGRTKKVNFITVGIINAGLATEVQPNEFKETLQC